MTPLLILSLLSSFALGAVVRMPILITDILMFLVPYAWSC